ncbi:MAG: response regulator [Candidatus Acididesulfobacter guangdongensis]|uniref:Response regulator n=1 Tax=Acididesulfobacter guangdongensis TaxID=2597225 RepID=A0A519BFX4_ACIG2|nr:MAG: response regulator [Candidatus Acididesulfobacter guangdongensis]
MRILKKDADTDVFLSNYNFRRSGCKSKNDCGDDICAPVNIYGGRQSSNYANLNGGALTDNSASSADSLSRNVSQPLNRLYNDDKTGEDNVIKTKFNILIAEDNEINAELMKTIIEAENSTDSVSDYNNYNTKRRSNSLPSASSLPYKINTVIAENGKKALDIIFSDANIDLIILDLMMPIINGFDVLQQIKSSGCNSRLANIPVLIVSALSESSTISKGIELGANDYITKPIVKNIFKAKVNSLINLKKLYDTLESSEHIIMSLALAVEAKDKYTSGHSKRVSMLAYNFGKYLGLGEEDCLLLKRAGCIHDIGKIGIPNDVLNKTGKLSDEEFKLIRNHSVMSSDICKPLISLKKESYIARYHHERFDGNGYPGELSSKNIPFLSRILSVVDSYDAMTSDRPYRKALSKEKALSIFEAEKESGQWDSDIVNELIKFINISDFKYN